MRRELLEPVEHKENLGRTLEMEKRKKKSRERESTNFYLICCVVVQQMFYLRENKDRE